MGILPVNVVFISRAFIKHVATEIIVAVISYVQVHRFRFSSCPAVDAYQTSRPHLLSAFISSYLLSVLISFYLLSVLAKQFIIFGYRTWFGFIF